ncbi:MAG: bacillithiol biosynthesis cysteine-adding enzyme BshC [Candidatus Kapaibacterium sp.]
MNIPYTSLNGYNDLFIDYLTKFEKVSQFFTFTPDGQGILNSINAKKESYNNERISRIELAEILKTQNKFFNSGESTFLNIEFLKEENTFAIVTGQQIGMLTGNLYTIIKALNAVQLSRSLSAKYTDYKFVPVFWLEADDHDFLEINNVNVFDSSNAVKNLSYFEKGVEKERYLTPTGRIVLDSHIEVFKQMLKDSLLQTEFTDELFDYINRSYKEGIDLITSFARFFNYMAGDKGVIFCNPTDKELKKMMIPVFEKELNTYPHTCEMIVDTSARLESKEYEPQVKPRSINIFYAHNNSRHLVEIKEGKFSLRHTRQKYEKEELFHLLYTNPENFSPNVILRPVCQDYLLPTVAYIGGPSEVAYFAQFRDVYNFFDMEVPVVYPRTSITILEKRVEAFLEKFDFGFEELFDEENVSRKLLGKFNAVNIQEVFGNFEDDLNAVMYTYSLKLHDIDKNLMQNLRNKYDKFLENLAVSKKKFEESQIKQNDSTGSKLSGIINSVYPNGKPQERSINISYFLNKYGFEFLNELFNTIEINKFSHQVISTDSMTKTDQPRLF